MDLPANLYYTGLVARLYRPLRSEVPDPEPYARFVAASGEPALELGCGDGDPLLDLRGRGLDVEGLDSSADMLVRCRDAAAAAGVRVVLHEQAMETMDLGRRYRSIYLAGATFNLLPDDEAAAQSLRRIHEHLDAGGSTLVPLFIPEATAPESFGRARETTDGDGRVLRVTPVSEERDEDRRDQVTIMRYELDEDGETIVVERLWLIHWHTQSGFRQLAADAGLEVHSVRGVDGRPAEPDASVFVFRLTPG
jgi:SAM-dependent methyltransferase